MLQLSNSLVQEELKGLQLSLPGITTPGGSYQSVVVRNKIAFVAIQFPIRDRDYLFTGRLGGNLTTEQGYEALQLCSLNVLAQIHSKVGFENVLALNHLDIYYRSVEPWDDAPKAANGASDLFVNVLKDAGHHTRSLVGVENLPRNFSAGLVSSFTLR